MDLYRNENVLEAAQERMSFLFDEFENVLVSFSGGKDSTVVLNLAYMEAKKRGRLPLGVMWIDQEAEWQATVDYCASVFEQDDIKPYWYQMPIQMTNNASSFDRYAECWEEGREWLHPKHPLSIKENRFGTKRFHNLFAKITQVEFGDKRIAWVGGMRTEETHKRKVALSHAPTYKWVTWAKRLSKNKEHYTFSPIYDWTYVDVWKYIHESNLPYNEIYDKYYQHGMNPMEMRVSNLHHETAIQSLMLVQELEPDTWEKLEPHIAGASSIKHLQKLSFTAPMEHPPMFESWEEYTWHLADNLIQDDDNYEKIKTRITKDRERYAGDEKISRQFWRELTNTILSSDWDFTKYDNFRMRPAVNAYRKWKEQGIVPEKYFKYLSADDIIKIAESREDT